jgi:hypothetical protein
VAGRAAPACLATGAARGLHPYQLYGVHPDAGAEMLSWVGSLLATIVVLPWRIASNRWPPPPDEPPSG